MINNSTLVVNGSHFFCTFSYNKHGKDSLILKTETKRNNKDTQNEKQQRKRSQSKTNFGHVNSINRLLEFVIVITKKKRKKRHTKSFQFKTAPVVVVAAI